MSEQQNLFRETVLDVCRRKGVSIRQLGERIGVNHSQISRSLNGKIPLKKDALVKWCQALDCSMEERNLIFHAAGFLSPDEIGGDSTPLELIA